MPATPTVLVDETRRSGRSVETTLANQNSGKVLFRLRVPCDRFVTRAGIDCRKLKVTNCTLEKRTSRKRAVRESIVVFIALALLP